jgi:aspartate carbamoyltransferase catalytic subunit
MSHNWNHFLGIRGLSREDILLLFDLANQFKEVLNRKIKKVPTLRDLTIANLFFENSTRTRISFELAEKRLSADVVNFSASSSSLTKGETLLDTVNNILAMKVDMIVLRHPAPGAALYLLKKINASIVNAGDGTHEHPTQALLDCFSISEKLGNLENLNVLLVGDILHSRVALSNILALNLLGAKVRVCGPPTLIPKFAASLGCEISHDIEESLRWADVANILRIQMERQDINYFPSLREYHQVFGITKKRLENCNRDLLIMHPGPINRGVEIASEVADGSQSIILDQVENGVAIRMAVLYQLASQIH